MFNRCCWLTWISACTSYKLFASAIPHLATALLSVISRRLFLPPPARCNEPDISIQALKAARAQHGEIFIRTWHSSSFVCDEKDNGYLYFLISNNVANHDALLATGHLFHGNNPLNGLLNIPNGDIHPYSQSRHVICFFPLFDTMATDHLACF